jgi:arylsulfatase A-like enzyme
MFAPGTRALADGPARPPNIVVVLADDLGYGDPGCYNKDSRIPTPHMDKLAKQGMRFTDAHTPASVCTPTRYGILTGRYPWRSALKKGVLQGYDPMLIEPGRLTLAALLRAAKYRTGIIGKWHLGLGKQKKADFTKPLTPGPNDVGFDYFFGISASLDMPPYVYLENDKVTQAATGMIEASEQLRKGGKGFWRAGEIAPDFKHAEVLDKITDKVVAWIGQQTREQPFFLYFALTAPHMPWLPAKEYVGKSQAGPYGDFVVHVDDVLGRVVKALDDHKLADDTLLIFTSDNGAYWIPGDIERWVHRANGELRGQKADIWEGGHRVPFIARWPGKVAAGSVTREVICLTDLVATAAALAGQKLPVDGGEDSFDIGPVLRGEKLKGPVREATVHQASDGTLAIRQGPWRLALALGSHGFSAPKEVKPKEGEPPGELINLKEDIQERKNHWQQEPEVVRRLTALLERYQKEGRSRPK